MTDGLERFSFRAPYKPFNYAAFAMEKYFYFTSSPPFLLSIEKATTLSIKIVP